MSRSRRARVGIALVRSGICAVVRGSRWSRNESPPRHYAFAAPDESTGGVSPADLRRAMFELRADLGVDTLVAHVALLPDVAQARRLEMPRLGREERRRALVRHVAKYFVGVHSRQVVGADVISSPNRSPIPIFAGAASAGLIDALFALEEHGVTIASVNTAYHAWVEAALAADRSLRGKPVWIVVRDDGELTCIQTDGRGPTGVRRYRVTDDASVERAANWVATDVVGASGSTEKTVGVMADPDIARELADAFRRAGRAAVQLVRIPHDGVHEAAATYVGSTSGFELLPDAVHERRRRSTAKTAAGFAAAAAVAVFLAAGVAWWGTHRELNALRTERADVREQVERAMGERELLVRLDGQLHTLTTTGHTSPRWSQVIADVAAQLPIDAHLIAFRARPDSLVLEGMADHAAGVFEAMQSTPAVVGVRARAPIRRELLPDDTAVEHFALTARLTRRGDREGAR